jgi:hypothetical protein
MSNLRDRSGNVKPKRFCVLRWWWSRYFGLPDALIRHSPTPAASPPPWSIEELEACFTVREHSGQALAYQR